MALDPRRPTPTTCGSSGDKFEFAMPEPQNHRTLAPIWRAIIEVGFIIFLFYSNLLMGEFTRSNRNAKTLLFAIRDVFTTTNFVIGVVSGLIGYVIVEYLRKKL